MRTTLLLLSLSLTPIAAVAQWDIQDAHVTAELRGIDNVGNGVAWASGSNGTVLHTADNGEHWQLCTVPPGAEHLDFRAVQAFDNETAIVMSSGKGDLSRLYKTADGCTTWKILFTDPDKDGFWDAMLFRNPDFGVLVGDPVNGHFFSRYTSDGGATWQPFANDEILNTTSKIAGIFAASNSAILLPENHTSVFLTANLESTGVIFGANTAVVPCRKLGLKSAIRRNRCVEYTWWKSGIIPISRSSDTSGLFGVGMDPSDPGGATSMIAVGGDYTKPNDPGMSAYTYDQLENWTASTTEPHGFRSAVAYDAPSRTWITVGPNGTDISTDNGRNWHPLKPGPQDPPNADRRWNSLSLPFVVGSRGRIGVLRRSALKPATP